PRLGRPGPPGGAGHPAPPLRLPPPPRPHPRPAPAPPRPVASSAPLPAGPAPRRPRGPARAGRPARPRPPPRRPPSAGRRAPPPAALRVDALWLSPFYPSELADGGYDVADPRDVDPRLGTLDDFDALVAEAHRLGLKVIVDIVPNHTSHQHVWFQEALRAGPGSAARDRYVFRDGRGERGELPPTDWQSLFGGSAWQRVPDGQRYLHLFAPEQPDLNWDNPEVRADFRTTLRFWSDRGVDGFRIDVAHALAKDL